MRVLLSAFACDPSFGSDEEVGWRWAIELRRSGHEVIVITRTSHRKSIEQAVAETPALEQIQFHYVDLPGVQRCLARINRRNHLYYFIWQAAATLAARRIIAAQQIDLIHHVTWVSARQPSFMGLLGRPFWFGPVAGGDTVPLRLLGSMSFNEKCYESVRVIINLTNFINPLMYLTFLTADRIFVTSESTRKSMVPAFFHGKTRTRLAIGIDAAPAKPGRSNIQSAPAGSELRLLYLGRLLSLKGLQLLLPAIKTLADKGVKITLTIVGCGPTEQRLKSLSSSLGLDQHIKWAGWVPKAEVEQWYARHDLLVFPSLRDSGGLTTLEAMRCGLPVLSLDLAGPGEILKSGGGMRVSTQGKSLPEISAGIAAAIECFAADAVLRTRLRNETLACVDAYSWTALVADIYGSQLEMRK